MKDRINARLVELSNELEQLINRRSDIQGELESIDVRIAQMAGAMQELSSLIQEEKNDQQQVETGDVGGS